MVLGVGFGVLLLSGKISIKIISFIRQNNTFFPFLVPLALGLTEGERSAVLKAHNDFRSDLANGRALNYNGTALPAGKNIYKMVRKYIFDYID